MIVFLLVPPRLLGEAQHSTQHSAQRQAPSLAQLAATAHSLTPSHW